MSQKKTNTIAATLASSIAMVGSVPAGAESDPAHSVALMNYHRVDDRLVTGGHLLDGGAEALQQQGVTVVIDLRDKSPDGEEQRFAEQGIQWINIPVVWTQPELRDFDRFRQVMKEHDGAHVLVQCAANYRASAMTYLYRVLVGGVAEGDAQNDMTAVWNPDEYPTWRDFIADVTAANTD